MEDTNTQNNTPKDVFLHFLNILAFYLSIISFITLYIQYINVLFPDPLNFYYTSIANQARLFTSMLVIAVPVYILTSWLLGRDLKEKPQKREFELRKWLLYLTLFVSAVTIIVDLIFLVYNFLSGELTSRFFLKVAVVLLVAAAVFGYYIWDLKRKDREASKTPKKLAWAVSLAVLASVVFGFFIVGTPSVQRDRRFDEQRAQDLQIVQDQIINYWQLKKGLPQTLDELKNNISGFSAPEDPETKETYEYNVIDPLTFELCAIFKTSSQDFDVAFKPRRGYGYLFQQNWEHEEGRACFTRTIDPELYKSDGQLKGIVPAFD